MLRSWVLLLLCAAVAAKPNEERQLRFRERVQQGSGSGANQSQFPMDPMMNPMMNPNAFAFPAEAPMNGPTLRSFLQKGGCFNLALAPLRASQPSLMGMADALVEENMLDKVGGISGVSSSAAAAAIMALKKPGAGKAYVESWPTWAKFGNDDKGLSKGFHEFLAQHVPEKFENLKTPIATTATAWPTDYDAYAGNSKKSRTLVSTKGGLHEAIIASSSAMDGPGCPDCLFGFKAKHHEGHYPVSDGAIADPDGTAGLVKLPQCSRLVHVWLVDYDGQLPYPMMHEIPGKPTELVTIEMHQPPSATYAKGTEDMKTKHGELSWNKKMYEVTHESILSLLDKPMQVKGPNHFIAETDILKRTRAWQSQQELAFDETVGKQRKLFWDTTAIRRSGVVQYLEPTIMTAKEM